jgi:serralysin
MTKRIGRKASRSVALVAAAATLGALAIASPALGQPRDSSHPGHGRAGTQTTLPSHQSEPAADFLKTLGVNTHLAFGSSIVPAYGDLSKVEQSIDYLGVKNLRDSAQGPNCAPNWPAVASATGAKFDDYIGEDSPYNTYFDLGCMPGLANENLLNFVEGGNEEDDAYPASLGNTIAITAELQKHVYATAQSLGLPTINMSFGAGWTADNDWHGDYDKVGDLSAITDYANAHDYPVPGATADTTIQQLNDDAHLAAASRPVLISEFGYDTNVTDSTLAAKGTLDAALDATKDGDAKIYYYALFDDTSGDFGLMNADATPKPAGLALHNLTALLAGGQPSGQTHALSYSVDGTQAADNQLLLQGSDGSYWLALWNESAAAHSVTVNVGCTAQHISTFDPLVGTTATASVSGASSAQVTIPDHPVLVHVQTGQGTC